MAIDTAPPSAQVDTRPKWLIDTLLPSFKSKDAFAFLITGPGTDDYVVPGLKPADYLAAILGPSNLGTIVCYSPGEGFTFPNDTSAAADHIKQMSGKQPRPGSKDAFLEALGPEAAALDDATLAEVVPTQAIALILKFLASAPKASATVIVQSMEMVLPHTTITSMSDPALRALDLMKRAGTKRALEDRGNLLIMLAPTLASVHEYLRTEASGVRKIEIGKPVEPERLVFIEQKMELDGWTLAPGLTPQGFARLTAGASRRNIEDIGQRARRQPITASLIKDRLAEIINTECDGLLVMRKPVGGLDRIGGNAELKAMLRRWVIEPWRSGNRSSVDAIPLVIGLFGPPGTGKSEIADAVGYELDVPVLEYGQQRASLYGETENNRAKAESYIRDMPCVVIMDEADQRGGRVQGGGGGSADAAEADMFRRDLMLLGDNTLRGSHLFLVMSNMPKNLDDALLSRCEWRGAMLLPENDEAIADMLVRMLARYGYNVEPPQFSVAPLMRDWSGRDMWQAVVKAHGLVQLDGMQILDALQRAAKTRKPLTSDSATLMAKMSLEMVNDLDLLPEKYRKQRENADQLHHEIVTLRDRGVGKEREIDL